jgi:hypothetical protein
MIFKNGFQTAVCQTLIYQPPSSIFINQEMTQLSVVLSKLLVLLNLQILVEMLPQKVFSDFPSLDQVPLLNADI